MADEQPEAEAPEEAEQAAPVDTVKMVRDAELHPEPHEADVHPDEVDNFAAAGWTLA